MWMLALFIVCFLLGAFAFLLAIACAADPEGRGGTYFTCYALAGIVFFCVDIGIVVRAVWHWYMGVS